MKSKDRFLIGIIAGIVVLVVAVVVMALLRRGQPIYRPEDTPEGVTFNYLLALRQGDYERARSYLSPSLVHYPADSDEFVKNIRNSYSFGSLDDDLSFTIQPATSSATQAIVQVTETEYYQGGLFDSGEYHSTFDVTLKAEEGGWKIVEAERYWYDCWSSTRYGCR